MHAEGFEPFLINWFNFLCITYTNKKLQKDYKRYFPNCTNRSHQWWRSPDRNPVWQQYYCQWLDCWANGIVCSSKSLVRTLHMLHQTSNKSTMPTKEHIGTLKKLQYAGGSGYYCILNQTAVCNQCLPLNPSMTTKENKKDFKAQHQEVVVKPRSISVQLPWIFWRQSTSRGAKCG